MPNSDTKNPTDDSVDSKTQNPQNGDLCESKSPNSKIESNGITNPQPNSVKNDSNDNCEEITVFESEMSSIQNEANVESSDNNNKSVESREGVNDCVSTGTTEVNEDDGIIIENVNTIINIGDTGKLDEAVVKIPHTLCADYRSGSESDSLDSESDSSTSSDDSSTSYSESEDEDDTSDSDSSDSEAVKEVKKKEPKKVKTDLSYSDLPPIEDLKISVPEDACVEIGTITSIVDTLVVVESYKGTAALDIDTVLFLDNGKRSLGRIFEILGPVSEPVYAVRFNSQDQINENDIKKGMKVYYAPKTQHTSFVFLSEVMKIRGSDASWKDNVEAPSEFQDFSDDEEEMRSKEKDKNPNGQSSSRKRPFNSGGFTYGNIIRPSRFKNFQSPQRVPAPNMRPAVCSPQSTIYSRPPPVPVYPYVVPPYPGSNTLVNSVPVPPVPRVPPHAYFTPRFSGPPFPSFQPLPYMNPNFPRPFFQQRMPPVLEGFGLPTQRHWMTPPPPPPTTSS